MRGIVQTSLLILGVCPIWSGCVHRTSASSTPNLFSLAVSMVTDARGESGLWRGAALHNGDRVRLAMTVREPLHLYVGHLASSGSWSTLYPDVKQPNSTPTPVGTEQSLPLDGSYQISGPSGREVFCVIAARESLSAQTQAALMKSALLAGEKDREPPPTIGVRDRGEVVWGSLNERGIGSVLFPLLHK